MAGGGGLMDVLVVFRELIFKHLYTIINRIHQHLLNIQLIANKMYHYFFFFTKSLKSDEYVLLLKKNYVTLIRIGAQQCKYRMVGGNTVIRYRAIYTVKFNK